MEWPSWEGHGPLSFIASVDCAMLPAGAVDIMLPIGGTLSFIPVVQARPSRQAHAATQLGQLVDQGDAIRPREIRASFSESP
ncbi:YwqG family protein (plasmid) [Streptomyces sp. NBC_01707]